MGESASWRMERYNVVIIGSGNVASHLAKAINRCHHVTQIYSRNISHATELAEQLNDCKATDLLTDLDKSADIYIISVSDDAINCVANAMPNVAGIVVHTSGSVEIELLANISNHIGVFYPLQTFSKDSEVNISEVPFFLEASDGMTMDALKKLAYSLSDHVYLADSYQRQTLHVAAVFACNFFNNLLDISTEILKKEGYSLEILAPLIEMTAFKALEAGAFKAQTGPAVRGDVATIHKHIASLDPALKEIYRLLSQSIIDRHNIQKKI